MKRFEYETIGASWEENGFRLPLPDRMLNQQAQDGWRLVWMSPDRFEATFEREVTNGND